MAKKIKYTIEQALRAAIAEASLWRYSVSPNPPVGCAILSRDYELLAVAAHHKAGEGHAEVNALKKIKNPKDLKGAHVVVTLEPCSHYGRTPPCAEALAKLPIASVTYGLKDPNPKVSGQGHAILKKAGIQVEKTDLLQEELKNLTEVFLYNMIHKKAFMAVKLATSLDGQIALKSGESQWITGEASRSRVQKIRALYDAILVGAGTVIKDDPSLTIRDEDLSKPQHKAIIVDADAQIYRAREKYKLFKGFGSERIVWIVDQKHKEAIDGQVISFQGQLDWGQVQSQLYAMGVTSALVEGGAYTASNVIEQKAFQRLHLFTAPKIIGAGGGVSWSSEMKITQLKSALSLEPQEIEFIGTDVLYSLAGFRGFDSL